MTKEPNHDSHATDAGARAKPSWGDRIERLAARVARAGDWVNHHRRLSFAIGGLTVLLISAGLWGMFFWGLSNIEEHIPTLDEALAHLDLGQDTMAWHEADALRAAPNRSAVDVAGILYIRGLVRIHEADEAYGEEKSRLYTIAARYLQLAQRQGFVTGRKAEGYFQLGRALFHSGQFTECQPPLEHALAEGGDRTTEIHRMLADAALKQTVPDPDAALQHIDGYLVDDRLTPKDQDIGRLAQAEILFSLARDEESKAILAKIRDDSPLAPRAQLLTARLAMRELDKLAADPHTPGDPLQMADLAKRCDALIQLLRTAIDHDTLETQVEAAAMYLIGRCYLLAGDRAAALAQFDRTIKAHFESAEGAAAGLSACELLAEQEKTEETLAMLRRTMAVVGRPEEYSNPWVSLTDFQRRLRLLQRRFLARRQFDELVEVLELIGPLLPRDETVEMQAEAQRQWGTQFALEAAGRVPADAAPVLQESQEHMRLAGNAFAELAQLRHATRQYDDHLWDSGQCLLEGNDFAGAVRVLSDYLATESRGHRAEAMVALGRALIALGQLREGLQVLEECVERHPRDMAIFTARLLAAQAHAELGDREIAEDLLRENLEGDFLTPDSPEWQQSLFQLGQMLYAAGRYSDAAPRLEEAVERYPTSPDVVETHYYIAESYRRMAEDPLRNRSDVSESTRLAQAKQAEQHLVKALAHYQRVQEIMDQHRETLELTPEEDRMLRNTHFSRGAVLYDLGRFREAIDAYSTAVNRQQNSPEVLEAYVQIAECYRRLNRASDARATLEQAKVVLKRMSPSLPFKETTNYTSDGWAQRLELMTQL